MLSESQSLKVKRVTILYTYRGKKGKGKEKVGDWHSVISYHSGGMIPSDSNFLIMIAPQVAVQLFLIVNEMYIFIARKYCQQIWVRIKVYYIHIFFFSFSVWLFTRRYMMGTTILPLILTKLSVIIYNHHSIQITIWDSPICIHHLFHSIPAI